MTAGESLMLKLIKQQWLTVLLVLSVWCYTSTCSGSISQANGGDCDQQLQRPFQRYWMGGGYGRPSVARPQ